MYIHIYILHTCIFRGYRVNFLISPPVSRLSMPYRPRVDRSSLRRSRRMIRSTIGRYGLLSIDTGGDKKNVTRLRRSRRMIPSTLGRYGTLSLDIQETI